MAEANYFHALLYSFDEDARKDVVRRFNDAMNDISARCLYLADQGMFELRTPGSIGPMADETLTQIIATYLQEELAAAERQERAPHVTRFADSRIGDFISSEVLSASTTADEPTLVANPSQPPPVQQSFTLHLIDTDATTATLKLFRLHELPAGSLERTLGNPVERNTSDFVRKGVRCRAVRWLNTQGGELVFNGRMGEALPTISLDEESSLLAKAPFLPLMGSAIPTEHEPNIRHWRFKEGHEVSVDQWVSGTGQTEFYDPNEQGQMPKDAKKMLAADHDQNPALGRVRVPKGMHQPVSDDSDDDSSDSDEPKPRTTGFSQLFQAREAKGAGSGGNDSASSASDDSETAKTVRKTTFGSLLASKPKENELVVAARSNAVTERPHATSDLTAQRTTSATLSASEDHSDTNDASQAPLEPTGPSSYDKAFAAVDKIGLMASAQSQAQWDLDHRSPRNKTVKSGLRLANRPLHALSTPPASGSASMSLSSGQDMKALERLPTPASIASDDTAQATVRSVARAPGKAQENEPAWTNRVVQARVTQRKLIDDSAPTSTFVKRPPGLGPPPGSRQASRATKLHEPSVKQADGSLISIKDDPVEPELTQKHQPPPPGFSAKLLQPAAPPTVKQRAPEPIDEDGQNVERLQQPAQEPSKRYTMRQQAQKKGKGKGNVPKAKPKLELPKPSPPAPPKKKAIVAATQGVSGSAPSKSVRSETTTGHVTDREQNVVPLADGQSSMNHAGASTTTNRIASFIEKSRGPDIEVRLQVRIGMILMQADVKALRKPFTTSEFRSDAVGASQLLQRLTTSTGDVLHLMGFGLVDASALYELHLRDSSNSLRTARCSSDAQMLDQHCWETTSSAFVHYPYRVWDAQWLVEAQKPLDHEDALIKLFSSFSTAGEAPSFCARVPTESGVIVEKVFAKRVFTCQRAVEGVRLVITEVQDLHLSSLNEQTANLKATCMVRDAMISEHRLWWEARVEADRDQLGNVGPIEEMVNDLITEMDGVGYGNEGPWRWEEVEKPVEQPFPFW